jgi:hypothetical protein
MTCYNCGNKIETIPTHCGQNMNYNENTNRWECYMGAGCGFINIDEMLCAKCAAKCNL